MSRSPVTRFTLAGAPDVDELIAGLVERATLVRDAPAPGTERAADEAPVLRDVLDTFDWRLHGAGTVLEVTWTDDGGIATWRSFERGDLLGRVGVDELPRFAWDLPPGPVAERLAGVLEMRALLPLVRLESVRRSLRLVDDEGKTVARLTVDRSTLPDGARLPVVVEVAPLRGYEREARRFADLLAAQVVLARTDDDVAVEALRRAGHRPGAYSSKLQLALDPDATALEAWTAVLGTLLDTLRANEAGVRADLDSEFLHDFRVAVRRARSVLGEGRGIFDREVLAGLQDDLGWLGRQTGPTRDLDVALLEVPAFEAGLPPERRDDLGPFVDLLRRRQARAHRALVADLDSPRSEALGVLWRGLVDAPGAAAGPRADRPARAVAADRIRRAHRRLVRDGRAIHDGSAPEALHDLRKDAKRLRYLLECFGSLFPAGEIAPVVRELKGLQEVLGDYQDSQVQADSIGRFAQELLDEGGAPAATLLAMGLVVDQLGAVERRARAGFAERFARFDRPEVRRRVRALGAAVDEAGARLAGPHEAGHEADEGAGGPDQAGEPVARSARRHGTTPAGARKGGVR